MQLPVIAFDSSGQRITMLHATAHLRDDSIARFINGRLYPLKRGMTWVEMDFDGIRHAVPVEVFDRVAVEKLRMVGGLLLAAFDANCTKAHEGDQHYYCIMGKHGSFVVENLAAPGSGIEREGEFSIYRKARQ